LADGTPSGGLSLVEGAAEVRTRIGTRWGAAAFVEAGTVGDHPTPSLDDVRWSAGLGVRYQLPFGPIRADLAFPLDDGPGASGPQIYISIGQAF
jgi:translocation and assembly module TamA